MKIATWNVERPKSSSNVKNNKIREALKKIDADVLILSETNSAIDPGEGYTSFSTAPLAETSEKDGVQYGTGENRVTVWTRYPVLRSMKTYDAFSAVCVCIDTPHGELNVYGTVVGFLGNRHKSFNTDLEAQLTDWETLCESGNFCIAGDLNITFSDNYYFTETGRQKMDNCFQELKINLLTRQVPENVDHIAISESFLNELIPRTEEWNRPVDRTISDHIGVSLILETAAT